MNNKVTMKDIALMANVTKSTVSRYFNGGYIKASTKEKVREIVERYGYEPNTFARLKAKKSRMVGIITPCLDSNETSKLLMYLDETLQNNGYSSLIVNTNHCFKNELLQIAHLSRLNLDALIIIATTSGDRYIDTVKNLDIPVLFVGQKVKGYSSIINDNVNACKRICDEIINTKCKNALLFTVDKEDEAIGVIRKNEIIKNLKKKKIKVSTVLTSFKKDEIYNTVSKTLIDKLHQVIICSTTTQIYAVYKAAKELHLRIPEDIAICGFGARSYFDIVTPEINCIHFDTNNAGITAANCIIALIEKKPVQDEIIIDFTYNKGNSLRRF